MGLKAVVIRRLAHLNKVLKECLGNLSWLKKLFPLYLESSNGSICACVIHELVVEWVKLMTLLLQLSVTFSLLLNPHFLLFTQIDDVITLSKMIFF